MALLLRASLDPREFNVNLPFVGEQQPSNRQVIDNQQHATRPLAVNYQPTKIRMSEKGG